MCRRSGVRLSLDAPERPVDARVIHANHGQDTRHWHTGAPAHALRVIPCGTGLHVVGRSPTRQSG